MKRSSENLIMGFQTTFRLRASIFHIGNAVLQILQTLDRRGVVICAGHSGGKILEQQVGFSVSIAEHAQELRFDVVQGVAVGSEHQAVFAADFAERQAAADDFQVHTVFLQIDAAQMRFGQAHVFA